MSPSLSLAHLHFTISQLFPQQMASNKWHREVESFGQCQMITGKENMTHVNTWRLTKETMINDNAWGERSPQFRTMPSDDWKRGHVRVHLEHIAAFHDQSDTAAPGTDMDWGKIYFCNFFLKNIIFSTNIKMFPKKLTLCLLATVQCCIGHAAHFDFLSSALRHCHRRRRRLAV